MYAEFGSNKHDQISKGVNLKKRFVRKGGKREVSTKRFDNSITIKLYKSETELLNIKIFKNGKIQMTGVKHVESGIEAVEFLITIVKDVNLHTKLVDDVDCLSCSGCNIHLINSDFKVNMEIRRDLLFQLITKEYDVTCTYEPCIYPGVKIQYFLNKTADLSLSPKIHGVCPCIPQCNGKGNGETTDSCKKITISIFQSGCILITGVTSIKHIEIGYKFITDILRKHEPEIKRIKLELP
jgi:TATA-box binding protein (TBP) (component of TFIID and TFIIIB)